MSLEKKLEEKGLIRKLNKENYENLTLEKDEFLLKIRGTTGFMSPLTQKNEIPKSFLNWTTEEIYIMKEEFRTNWEMSSIHNGMSTCWVVCKHPFGFYVEINPKAFNSIIKNIEIKKGIIITPLYFAANIKNSELLIK